MDPELGKFKAGSGSGINHSGSATLVTVGGPLTYTIIALIALMCAHFTHNYK